MTPLSNIERVVITISTLPDPSIHPSPTPPDPSPTPSRPLPIRSDRTTHNHWHYCVTILIQSDVAARCHASSPGGDSNQIIISPSIWFTARAKYVIRSSWYVRCCFVSQFKKKIHDLLKPSYSDHYLKKWLQGRHSACANIIRPKARSQRHRETRNEKRENCRPIKNQILFIGTRKLDDFQDRQPTDFLPPIKILTNQREVQ